MDAQKKGGLFLIESAAILPTGDEISGGIVLDTDSVEVMRQLLSLSPRCKVTRCAPALDSEEEIARSLISLSRAYALVIVIGGSGGGRKFCPSLGIDASHSALDLVLEEKSAREIYGPNGHLWCRLLIGRRGRALLLNLPGPFVEAKAAMQAFCTAYPEHRERYERINDLMRDAVLAQYPQASGGIES